MIVTIPVVASETALLFVCESVTDAARDCWKIGAAVVEPTGKRWHRGGWMICRST